MVPVLVLLLVLVLEWVREQGLPVVVVVAPAVLAVRGSFAHCLGSVVVGRGVVEGCPVVLPVLTTVLVLVWMLVLELEPGLEQAMQVHPQVPRQVCPPSSSSKVRS